MPRGIKGTGVPQAVRELLDRHPDGLTTEEIAEQLKLSPTTASSTLQQMHARGETVRCTVTRPGKAPTYQHRLSRVVKAPGFNQGDYSPPPPPVRREEPPEHLVRALDLAAAGAGGAPAQPAPLIAAFRNLVKPEADAGSADAPDVAVQPQPARATPTGFRCAMWSDGHLQLETSDGQTVSLSVADTRGLLQYLDRVLAEGEVS